MRKLAIFGENTFIDLGNKVFWGVRRNVYKASRGKILKTLYAT